MTYRVDHLYVRESGAIETGVTALMRWPPWDESLSWKLVLEGPSTAAYEWTGSHNIVEDLIVFVVFVKKEEPT